MRGAPKPIEEGAGEGECPGVEHAERDSILRKSGISTLRKSVACMMGMKCEWCTVQNSSIQVVMGVSRYRQICKTQMNKGIIQKCTG